MQRVILAGLIVGLALAAPLAADAKAVRRPPIPAAVFTDPPADAAHPPRMEVLHIPSGGVEINARGLPGPARREASIPPWCCCTACRATRRTLDLAQAIRRAGWNVITFNYRGSSAAPGPSASRGTWPTPRRCWSIVRDPAQRDVPAMSTRASW